MSAGARERGFEWWMISNVGTGVATAAFLNLLIPPFVAQVTGSAARVGIVFAAISLSAVIGPWVGKLATRTGAYRLIYTTSLLAMAGAFAFLIVDSAVGWYSPLFGIIVGMAYATQGTIGPTFIVGAGLDGRLVARRLTAYNLAYPVGQLVGSFIVAAAQLAGMGTTAVFCLATGTLVVFALGTWPGLARPVARVLAADTSPRDDTAGDAPPAARVPRARVVASAFGSFLVVVVLSSIGNNGLTSQLANVMPAVYGFSNAGTSMLLGVAGLLNLAVILIAGRWMGKVGSLSPFVFGTVLRGIGALLMAVVALFTTPVLALAGLAMLVTYQAVPIPRLAASDVAARLAPGSAATANGTYFAASAVGSVVGCLATGLIADVSFDVVVWFAAAVGVAAGGVAVGWLVPAARRMR